MNAIDTILDEHRSLAAVLHGLLYLVRAIDSGKMGADFKLMGAMVYYIDAFPERFHHPKEDEYLFKLLRLRRPESGALLRFEHGGADGFAAFAAAVEAYAAFHWQHMRSEEEEILPLARQYLLPD